MNNKKSYGKKIDLALSLYVKLSRAYQSLNKKSIENIKSFGLTAPQFSVLECLGHLGPMTLSKLSKKQLVSGGNITLIVDNLEKNNLVERIKNKTDRRTMEHSAKRIEVKLTDKGDKLFNSIFIEHAKYMTELFSILSSKEKKELSELLKKLGTSLN